MWHAHKASHCCSTSNNRDYFTGQLHYHLFTPHTIHVGAILRAPPVCGASCMQRRINQAAKTVKRLINRLHCVSNYFQFMVPFLCYKMSVNNYAK